MQLCEIYYYEVKKGRGKSLPKVTLIFERQAGVGQLMNSQCEDFKAVFINRKACTYRTHWEGE
jgi:hypothetical protein